MSTPERPPRVFLIAGEVSGDLHGAELSRALRAISPLAVLEGVGGLQMRTAGVRLFDDSSTWAVIGWVDAFRQLRTFARRLDDVVRRVLSDPPDVVVPIDFSGFNIALLKRLGRRVPAVYYVPPMVSTRRGRRAERVASLGSRLLAILPFEAAAYERAGADVTFVGHPAVDHMRDLEPPERVRERLGIPVNAPVLGLLPGSREGEIARLLEPMLAAARLVRESAQGVHVILALASPLFARRVQAAVSASGLPVRILEGARDVMRASTVLLMASGTATAEAMVLGVPMVVTYRVARINWWLLPFVVRVRRAALPNLMGRGDLVPELLQSRATAENFASEVLRLLKQDGTRDAMRRSLLDAAKLLGDPGVAQRAAAEVLAAAASPTAARPAVAQP
jgi:lipid-A-disaccharide synthase